MRSHEVWNEKPLDTGKGLEDAVQATSVIMVAVVLVVVVAAAADLEMQ